jgi:uncharacterized Tic20 family protein
MWCHLAPLLLGIFSVLFSFFGIGIVMGLFLWVPALVIRLKAKNDDFVLRHANESMNFQLFWLIISAIIFVAYLVIGILTVGIGLALGAIIFLLLMLPIGIFLLISMIRGSIAASSGRPFKYPFVWFRIVR